MRLTSTPVALPPTQSLQQETAQGTSPHANANENAAKPAGSPHAASVMRGNGLRHNLLRQCRTGSRTSTGQSSAHDTGMQLDEIATAAFTSHDAIIRELATALLPHDAVIGHGQLTARQEQEAFGGFERPGFGTPEAHSEAAQKFLDKIFKSPDDLADAATHVNAPLHRVASLAVKRGLVPGNTLVGQSTVAEELRLFGGLRVAVEM